MVLKPLWGVALTLACIFAMGGTGQSFSFAQETIDPVRIGDEIEVQSFRDWYSGTVESFADGKATVRYQYRSFERTSEFTLENMRFPNGEGHWTIWKDASGKFSVEGRYLSRTKTDVTIRKADGTEATVPIANLHPSIRAQLAKTPITADIIAPVRVGDVVEVKYFSKWYEGTIQSVRGQNATVQYDKGGSSPSTGDFKLEDMRFPGAQGHWMLWKDASGKFQVEARYISRTESDVTLRKVDGTDLTIPIESLHPTLRQQVAKTIVTSELNKVDGAIPIRVGDRVQIKSYSSWYDGVVKEVKIGAAVVQYERGSWGPKSDVFELKDMRYPNGEGPWREWSDSSGGFKIIARYMGRDETHVTILKEDQSELRVPIDKLSAPLRKLLKDTPVITRRPARVVLAGAELIGDASDGRTRASSRTPSSASSAPDLASASLTMNAPVSQQTLRLPQGGTAIPIGPEYTADLIIPGGGSEGWVLASDKADWPNKDLLTHLHWASLANKRASPGPTFHPDQRLVAYSPGQQRLVMSSVQGTWSEPSQLSTYRLAPGQASARSEMTFDIPKDKHSYNREPVRVELIGENTMLFGFGGKVSLWDLDARRVLYEVSNLQSHTFQLSIDHQYFSALSGRSTISVYRVDTGEPVAQGNWQGYGATTACFSRDGKSLMAANSSGIYRWDLSGNNPVATLPIGGLRVSDKTPLADLGGGWIVAGAQIYSTGLGLIVWRYDGGNSPVRVSINHQQMLGRQMLVAATAGDSRGKSLLVGVATVPHQDAIELMKKVDPDSVRMLVRGSRVKIDTSVDSRIVAGLRRAAQQNGWVEDPSSEAILTGSAKQGESQTLTYRKISFGSGGSGEETHTVSPWIQSAKVLYRDKTAWVTAMGGVPYSMHLREGESLGGELSKSSSPNYALFENLKIPDEIIYPKFQQGLGSTLLTPNGFVDVAK
jgi:FKBP-type peptidyl-prolyl cis-trans isomerase 2